MNRSSLIIFVRNPILGKVKTRLAKTIGNTQALKIYYKLLEYTHAITKDLPVSKSVYYSNEIEQIDLWHGPFQKLKQASGNLGQKMKLAFEQQFNCFQRICIIGSDCPELSEEILVDTFKKLKEYDVVIGPAKDGGYYLLGMSRYEPSLFDDIEWSSPNVLSHTIQKIKALNLSYFELVELSDIDTENDWIDYCNKKQALPSDIR